MNSSQLPRSLIGCIWLLVMSDVSAWDYAGYVKYSFNHVDFPETALAASLGGDQATSQGFNGRWIVSDRQAAWAFEAHYELSALHSNTHNLPVFSDPDQRRWLDLSHVFENDERDYQLHRLDRFNLSYTTSTLVLRLGRQAVTWGNGLVFHPIDIFNPFQPVAIDKDYKTGDDMLYGQWTTEAGNDWQMILLPRRNLDHDLDNSESSVAFKYHAISGQGDFDLLLSRHYDQPLIGLGYSRAVGEALWRLDITHSDSDISGGVTSLVSNLDYSWVWFEHNVYGFVEYYHNGFGQNNVNSSLNPQLLASLERGELFVLARNYLALGLQIELHPLLNFSPSWIVNLHDHSGLMPLQLSYNWQQNLQLTVQAVIAYGDPDSEYDGLYASGDSLGLLLAFYF